MRVLVTGGAGYIGSHTCLELLNAGQEVIIFDNLSNSSEESLERVQKLANKSLVFVQGDIRNQHELDQVFQDHQIDAVIHFAGLKAVGESQVKPLIYFDNNLQKRVVNLFDDSLAVLGFLALGTKETIKYSISQSKYKQFDKEKIWRKIK